MLGESGLGKSTLINTLFETKLYQPKVVPEPGTDRGKTVQIESISAGELRLTAMHYGPVWTRVLTRRYRGERDEVEAHRRRHARVRRLCQQR
jgi:septin family protein